MSTPPTDGPATPPDVQRARTEIEALLERLGVEWTLAGALAADKYRATRRWTTDADFLVLWHPELPASLASLGFAIRLAFDGPDVHLIRVRRGDAAVDLMVAITDYQRDAIARGLGRELTIEDVLVHKVIAWREKDRLDIRSILARGLPFDEEYVAYWSAVFGMDDRWDEAKTWR